ncbi:MAG: hypothetical protein M0R02_05340 [Bacteroidales bacterium]|nr:hypothetical protein [Bacteroidales bacterium]
MKMLKKIILVSFLVLPFFSCSKRTDSLIVGEWMIEDVGQPNVPADAQWTFFDDGRIDIYNDVNGIPNTSIYGDWKAFNRSIVTPYIQIKNTGPKNLDGKWRVERLTKSQLVINRLEFNDGETAGAFMRREFLKK